MSESKLGLSKQEREEIRNARIARERGAISTATYITPEQHTERSPQEMRDAKNNKGKCLVSRADKRNAMFRRVQYES